MSRRALAFVATLLLSGAVNALDYRSVAEAAVLFDAPSQRAKPLFVIAAGTPVEAVVTLDTWIKVRDMNGDLAWIERRQLAERRYLQVRAAAAQVRANADDSAALLFEAAPDVLLELLEPGPAGWAKVRHRDGQQGFVKTTQIWGF
jgi:SH3-like domain-containing protein